MIRYGDCGLLISDSGYPSPGKGLSVESPQLEEVREVLRICGSSHTSDVDR
jgi:hypothetical protein